MVVTYTNSYDGADRIIGETRNATTVNYLYDANSQLTNDGTTTFAYDLNGNRTMAGYSTGTANRLATDGTWTYTYDAEGNLTKKTQGASAETWTYGFDHRNQLSWAEKRATDGGTLQKRLDYDYDVYGNLVQQDVTVSGVTTTTKHAHEVTDTGSGIAHSVNPVWADLDSGGSLTTRYLLGDGEGERLARTGAATAWLLQDRLGSVREVTDGSGSIVNVITYNGFGGITAETDSTKTGNYTFAGMMRDSDAGLLVAHWRYYDTSSGNWLAEDPIAFAAGDPNLRRYVSNHPTGATDLDGLDIKIDGMSKTTAEAKEIASDKLRDLQSRKLLHYPPSEGVVAEIVEAMSTSGDYVFASDSAFVWDVLYRDRVVARAKQFKDNKVAFAPPVGKPSRHVSLRGGSWNEFEEEGMLGIQITDTRNIRKKIDELFTDKLGCECRTAVEMIYAAALVDITPDVDLRGIKSVTIMGAYTRINDAQIQLSVRWAARKAGVPGDRYEFTCPRAANPIWRSENTIYVGGGGRRFFAHGIGINLATEREIRDALLEQVPEDERKSATVNRQGPYPVDAVRLYDRIIPKKK